MKKLTLTNIKFFVFLFITIIASSKINAKESVNNSKFNQDLKNYNAKLKIFSNNKLITEFNVAIADSEEKKSYGLMNLDSLPKKNGMIFIFENQEIVNMWMKNTRISLDMIFINHNNEIIKIVENTSPYSTEIISSQNKVSKVLEINAGLAKELKIKTGQKIKLINNK